jgi:Protein of unknown function (DUF4239)
MLFFLTTSPLWLSGLILIGPTTAVAMAGPYVIRRFVGLSRLRTNNEVAGFKFATVGVLYAVLLAFAVVVVWEKFNDADNGVAREAGAAATVYRLANGIGGDQGAAIRNVMNRYLNLVIAKDWPAMQQGRASRAATDALSEIYLVVLNFRPADNSGAILLGELLRQVDLVGEARRARLVTADGIVPDIIWLVLFVGATLTIGFTFFFGAENIRAQATMTGVLSILIFAGLLTIISIDRPFAGPVSVGSEPLLAVLDDFGAVPPH